MARVLMSLYPGERYSRTVLTYSNPWELTVSVILSARTTDKKVNEVTAKLFKKYKRLSDYTSTSPKKLSKDISQLGFFNTKAKNIIAAAKLIESQYGGNVPKTMEDMITLPGVARKTANVVLWNAYGIVTGAPVDTHVRRFAIRFGLSQHKDSVKIELDLMELLPKKEWPAFTHRLILYGREICPGRVHQCKDHPLTKIYPGAANIWPKSR